MSSAGATDGIFQPEADRYIDSEKVKNLHDLLPIYGVTPTDNTLLDLSETTLLFRVDNPGTDDEVLSITSGRYDGLRFSGLTGKALPPVPTTRPGAP